MDNKIGFLALALGLLTLKFSLEPPTGYKTSVLGVSLSLASLYLVFKQMEMGAPQYEKRYVGKNS